METFASVADVWHAKDRRRQRRSIWSVIALASTFVLTAPPAATQAGTITEANFPTYIASAKTAADHKALATFFLAQATASRERAKRHELMLERHRRTGGKPYLWMKDHCQRLIGIYQQAEKEYRGLAEAHLRVADVSSAK